MSAFLGPIHYWMYSKIECAWRREGAIFKALVGVYGDEAKDLWGRTEKDYESFNEGRDLAELVGAQPIHGWLQGAIDLAERSEAELVKAFAEKFGEEAIKVMNYAAWEHGASCGRTAQGGLEGVSVTPDKAHQAMMNFYLDGMPCDHVTELSQTADGFVCRHSECLHERNWEAAEASPSIMCGIHRGWMDGFLEGLGAGIVHEGRENIASGDDHCVDIFRSARG